MSINFFNKALLKSAAIVGSLLIISDTNWASTQEHQKQPKDTLPDKAYYSNGTLQKVDTWKNTKLDHVIVTGPTTTRRGYLKVKDSQLNTLDARGHTTLRNSIVHGIVSIRGRADLDNTQLNGLTTHVKGQLQITNSTVKSALDVKGQLQAMLTTFAEQVHAGGNTRLFDSIFHGIVSIRGRADLYNTQLNGLTTHVKNQLHITNSTVKSALHVQGKFQAMDTTFEEQVHTVGDFKAQNSIFKNSVTTRGAMKANQTEFTGTVSSTAQKIVWHDVTAQDLYVHKLDDSGCKSCQKCQEPQVITLSGKTVIRGSITFESKKGVVLLEEESIIEGDVIGGIIKKA